MKIVEYCLNLFRSSEELWDVQSLSSLSLCQLLLFCLVEHSSCVEEMLVELSSPSFPLEVGRNLRTENE